MKIAQINLVQNAVCFIALKRICLFKVWGHKELESFSKRHVDRHLVSSILTR